MNMMPSRNGPAKLNGMPQPESAVTSRRRRRAQRLLKALLLGIQALRFERILKMSCKRERNWTDLFYKAKGTYTKYR